ncbi:MAG: hypothetical protein BroJett020_09910 [Bacteroidota bacterium]|nr:MAG: hypothetical protein BroJett020_09910 [Bacteroidota bacterium]
MIASTNKNQQKDLCVDFNYNLDVFEGEWSCNTPKDNCSKVKPCNTSILYNLDLAILSDTVSLFFSNEENWSAQFPNFYKQEEELLLLQLGRVHLVKETSAMSPDIFYIAIDSSASPTNYTLNDVKFAVDVTDDANCECR